jgi:hypothetical protein
VLLIEARVTDTVNAVCRGIEIRRNQSRAYAETGVAPDQRVARGED